MGALIMRNPSLLALAAALLSCSVAACAVDSSEIGSHDDDVKTKRAQDVAITVKASDSAAAKGFLSDFIPKFREIVRLDMRDDSSGVSTREELEAQLYKAKRNDGTITCTNRESCTFKLRVLVVDGKPVSKGDRNTWAGQLKATFAEPIGDALGGGQGQAAEINIGDPAKKIYIACMDDGAERGLATAACTFHLEK
jgi:hypothetical protein